MSIVEEDIFIDESYLIKRGISKDHLDQMKKELVQLDIGYHYFYDMVDTEEDVLVPVNKIQGLSSTRGEANRSWFNHIARKAGGLSLTRLNSLRRSLENQGLESFRESFKEREYQVRLIHYDEEDNYYVGGDGNHRTVWAKIVNAPSICARVSRYKINHKNRTNYQAVRKLKYVEVIDQLERSVQLHKKLSRFISNTKKRVFLLKVLEIFANEKRLLIYDMLLRLYKAGWPNKG